MIIAFWVASSFLCKLYFQDLDRRSLKSVLLKSSGGLRQAWCNYSHPQHHDIQAFCNWIDVYIFNILWNMYYVFSINQTRFLFIYIHLSLPKKFFYIATYMSYIVDMYMWYLRVLHAYSRKKIRFEYWKVMKITQFWGSDCIFQIIRRMKFHFLEQH